MHSGKFGSNVMIRICEKESLGHSRLFTDPTTLSTLPIQGNKVDLCDQPVWSTIMWRLFQSNTLWPLFTEWCSDSDWRGDDFTLFFFTLSNLFDWMFQGFGFWSSGKDCLNGLGEPGLMEKEMEKLTLTKWSRL